MTGPVPVAEIVRSGFVEGHHYGSVVALAADGSVDWSVGVVDVPVLPRSCNKPVQALGMVRAGLDLPDDLLALACASHSGEPFHVEGARRILALAGLDESALRTPADYPLDDAAREVVIRAGGGPDARPDELLGQARRDARDLRASTAGTPRRTLRPTTRSRSPFATTFAEMTGEPVTTVAIDGCGAPLFSTSLVGLATRLSPAGVGPRRRRPGRRGGAARRRGDPRAPRARLRHRPRRGDPPAGDPRRHRQGGGRVVLRGRARRRPRLRAQDRRRCRRVSGRS